MRREAMPFDLTISVLIAASTLVFTLVSPLSDLPVRIPLGLAMVLFIPGYTLISALFPKRDDLDGIERVALSFGMSIAVVPLIGLGLNYTPWGIRLTPIAVSLAVFTVAMATVAYFRRSSLSEGDRFSVGFRNGFKTLKQEILEEKASGLDKILTALLIISILASVTALAYVVVMPKQGEKFTEFYILGPKGKAYDYPTEMSSGNASTLIVGVVNHEYREVNYTMDIVFYNSTILRRNITLDHNATWEQPVNYTLAHPGDEQKLEFLLYNEGNFTAPYRDLHLWVNVSGEGEDLTSLGTAGESVFRAGEGEEHKKRKPEYVAVTYSGPGTEDGSAPSQYGYIQPSLEKMQPHLNSLTEEPESSTGSRRSAEPSSSTSFGESEASEDKVEGYQSEAEASGPSGDADAGDAITENAEKANDQVQSSSGTTQTSGTEIQSPQAQKGISTSSTASPGKPVALSSGKKSMVDLG